MIGGIGISIAITKRREGVGNESEILSYHCTVVPIDTTVAKYKSQRCQLQQNQPKPTQGCQKPWGETMGHELAARYDCMITSQHQTEESKESTIRNSSITSPEKDIWIIPVTY